jgi:hypothetical protein
MKKELVMAGVFMLLILKGNSQQSFQALGSTEAGVAMQGIWMSQTNSAGMADLKSFTAGIASRNRFLLPELSEKSVVVAFPLNRDVIGSSYYAFGGSLFEQSTLSLIYSRCFYKRIATGIRLNYYRYKSGDNTFDRHFANFDFGIRTIVAKDIAFGVNLINPGTVFQELNESSNTATGFTAGFLLGLSSMGSLSIDVRKHKGENPALHAALKYCNRKRFCVETGFTTNPFGAHFGVGIGYKNLAVDFSSEWHQFLGYSPAISLLYQFENNK